MTEPAGQAAELTMCPCGCNRRLTLEAAEPFRSGLLRHGSLAGQPDPDSDDALATSQQDTEAPPAPAPADDPAEVYESEQRRRQQLVRDGGLEGSSHRLAHVESRPDHANGIR